jgi:uncharacterized SAM-binding protein YcdF (DUF218 family)
MGLRDRPIVSGRRRTRGNLPQPRGARSAPAQKAAPRMNALVSELLNPLLLLLLAVGLALASLWWRRGQGRRRLWLVTLAFVMLWFLCTPLAAHLSLSTLEAGYRPMQDLPSDVKAIVVLGGSLRRPNAQRNWTELEYDTLRRCVEAERLCRQGAPEHVIVSGGKVEPSEPGPTLAAGMAEFLSAAGIDPIVQEGRSRNTHENAVECAVLLRKLGLDRCVLITDSTHQMRASACFQAEGIQCVPAAVNLRTEEFYWQLAAFLPSPGAAAAQQVVLHEWVGLLWYRLRGWV